MNPVKSNITNRACADPIGSNCVLWTGSQLCSATLCGVSTLTDVITALDNAMCDNSLSVCYTGQWVDFSGTIPLSGTGSGSLVWSISAFGGFGTNVPEYKWTKEGDLSIRGEFTFTYSASTVGSQTLTLGLTTIPTTCFPVNGQKVQYSPILDTHVIVSNGNKVVSSILVAKLGIIPATGSLFIVIDIIEPIPTGAVVGVTLGGTRFNLA